MNMTRDLRNAFVLGSMCVVSYLGCYFSRNILSVVTTEMIAETVFTEKTIGTLATVYMIVYALGQLINGRIGDMFRAKWLVGAGLVLSGICNIFIPVFPSVLITTVFYGASAFFQSMIYAPLMRTVAENTLPRYANRCSLGFTVASFLGTPVASFVSMILNWKYAFCFCGIILILLGVFCYAFFTGFEKRGIITYKEKVKGERQKTNVPLLIERGIITFTLVAILTGIVRTSVVFWIPTYLEKYLSFSSDTSAVLFSVITIIKTTSPYVGILIFYEKIFKRNMNKMLVSMFFLSAVTFFGMYFIKEPVLNVILLTLALLTSGCASTMLFSVWCPSLRDTGMVSTATGFADASSYLGAAIANLLFANAITTIGWGWLIISWSALMALGVACVLPYKKSIN